MAQMSQAKDRILKGLNKMTEKPSIGDFYGSLNTQRSNQLAVHQSKITLEVTQPDSFMSQKRKQGQNDHTGKGGASP